MSIRVPVFKTIAAAGSLTVPAGWNNIAILPATGATVTLDNGSQTIPINIPIVLGGANDNGFNNPWGEIIISTAGAGCDVIINGNLN